MKKFFRAFTLVELLVVIVIIGLLATISIPVFQGAQERARATQDANNLRNLGLGTQIWANDNSGLLYGDPAWANLLRFNSTTDTSGKGPVPDVKLFRSPFDPRGIDNRLSYGLNTVLTGSSVLIDDLRSPSTFILMSIRKTAPANSSSSFDGVFPGATIASGGLFGTHQSNKRANVLFGDFHIESQATVTFTGTNVAKYWNVEGN